MALRHSLEELLEDPSGAWLAALALLTPVILLYLVHFLLQPAWIWPSGFLHYDHAALMAETRQYFDTGFEPLRSLPYSDSRHPPRVYFEPQALALGALANYAKLRPGALNAAAGLIMGLICLRVAIGLYGAVVGYATPGRRFGLLLFAWGGGIFAALGLASWIAGGAAGTPELLRLEPGDSWWGLNFGRSLFSPEQAYFHALFLGALLALLHRHFALTLLLCLVLAASDGASGLQLLLVALLWTLLERGFLGDRRAPLWFAVALALLLATLAGYHLVYLPLASWEHRMSIAQAGGETLALLGMVGGYALVAALAFWRLRNRIHAAPVLGRPGGRLLLVWALVSFALANHEMLFAPQEPLRFTRGYLWMPLFLIGAPLLAALADRFALRRRGGAAMLAGLAVVFLLDSAVFLATESRAALLGTVRAETLSRTQKKVIDSLNDPRFAGYMVVTPDRTLGYLTTVYTPLRSWYSHRDRTPVSELRRQRLEAFETRQMTPGEWLWDDVVFVLKATPIEAGRLPWLRYGMTVEDAPGPYVFIVSPGR